MTIESLETTPESHTRKEVRRPNPRELGDPDAPERHPAALHLARLGYCSAFALTMHAHRADATRPSSAWPTAQGYVAPRSSPSTLTPSTGKPGRSSSDEGRAGRIGLLTSRMAHSPR